VLHRDSFRQDLWRSIVRTRACRHHRKWPTGFSSGGPYTQLPSTYFGQSAVTVAGAC
jgi:hypothetical protein